MYRGMVYPILVVAIAGKLMRSGIHTCECARVRSRSHAGPVINPRTHAHNSPLNCLVNGPTRRIKWKLFNAAPGLIYSSPLLIPTPIVN